MPALVPLGFWALSGAGGGAAPAFELISTVTTSGNIVDFTSIPQTYKHLQVRFAARFSYNVNYDLLAGQFNQIFTNAYTSHYLLGNGSSVSSGVNNTAGATVYSFGQVPGAFAPTSVFGGGVIDILDYTNTNKTKTIRSFSGTIDSTTKRVALESSYSGITAAITAIRFVGLNSLGFAAGTRFSLYGSNG